MQNEDYSSSISDSQFIYSERFLAGKEEQRTAAPLLRDMSKGDSMAEHGLYPQLLKSSVWAKRAAQPPGQGTLLSKQHKCSGRAAFLTWFFCPVCKMNAVCRN